MYQSDAIYYSISWLPIVWDSNGLLTATKLNYVNWLNNQNILSAANQTSKHRTMGTLEQYLTVAILVSDDFHQIARKIIFLHMIIIILKLWL